MESAIKALKRRKSTGPDKILINIFIQASKQPRAIHWYLFHNILTSKQIPQQWQKGEIIRLYKDKGEKGKIDASLWQTTWENSLKDW